MSRFSLASKLRLILASLLSLWVAGAGCMLGCESMIAMAADSSGASTHQNRAHTIVASGDVCASGEANSAHGCCKKNKTPAKKVVAPPTRDPDAALPEVSGTTSGTMNSCPLAMGRAAVVAKPHSRDASVSQALAPSVLPEVDFHELTAPLSTPLRLPNRGHTYLHCCAFLI